jgi:hypothetical protein
MKLLCLFLLCSCAGMPMAAGQTAPRSPAASNAPITGSAGVQTQLRSLHYKDIHDLRRGPDGQWTGKATQNGVEKQVTVSPKGTVTAR